MQQNFHKFRRSSRKLIHQIMTKLNAKDNAVCLSTISEDQSESELKNPALRVTWQSIPVLCEQLGEIIDYIRNTTNFNRLADGNALTFENKLKENVHELEDMLKEIRGTRENIQKYKMQMKSVGKEKIAVSKALTKLKDAEIHEMETIVSVFDKAMHSRWESVKSTRRPEVLEGFLTDIKSKQLALENLNTLVSRRLASVKKFENSTKNKPSTAIPLSSAIFSPTAIVPKPPPMPGNWQITISPIAEQAEASSQHLKID